MKKVKMEEDIINFLPTHSHSHHCSMKGRSWDSSQKYLSGLGKSRPAHAATHFPQFLCQRETIDYGDHGDTSALEVQAKAPAQLPVKGYFAFLSVGSQACPSYEISWEAWL